MVGTLIAIKMEKVAHKFLEEQMVIIFMEEQELHIQEVLDKEEIMIPFPMEQVQEEAEVATTEVVLEEQPNQEAQAKVEAEVHPLFLVIVDVMLLKQMGPHQASQIITQIKYLKIL